METELDRNTIVEYITTGERIYCAGSYQADNFEAITLSFFQKLNEERAEILEDFYKSRRIYQR